MSKKRRVLTFIAALTLYALTMPISAFATTTIKVGSGDEFRQAARTVNTAADDEYIIESTSLNSPTIFKLGKLCSPLRVL